MIGSDFLNTVKLVSDIKKQEAIMPIARRSAMVTPLKVGDDLSLRTSLISPVQYDRMMIELIHSHTEIVTVDKNIKEP